MPVLSESVLLMEFHEKLQILRKEKGLTQEELAEHLYVSRAAISKWESGRGYPNIDSLKAIAGFFSVTIDELLSSGEVLTLAEKEAAQKRGKLCGQILGCLDCSAAILYVLPIFGQTVNGQIQGVSLFSLTETQLWLKVSYFVVIGLSVLMGILTLALQSRPDFAWEKQTIRGSLLANLLLTFLFILSRQPYGAAISLIFLILKVLILPRKQ